MGKRVKKTNLNSCNVLELHPGGRRLWEFDVTGGVVKVNLDQSSVPPQPLPAKVIGKDWHTLWQRKLNIAWLPAGQVFLRAIQVPATEFGELVSMVELQLEKISPLPVTQIVWTIEPLALERDGMRTVIVALVSRNVVEAFLGQLEADGFLADRLELPELHQLLSVRLDDGIWLIPNRERRLCLVAWMAGGTLQNLQLIHLPESIPGAVVAIEHLTKMAWAGEVEGWLPAPILVHLLADVATAEGWQQPLEEWANHAVQVVPPRTAAQLAEFSARRAAVGESKANLLPPEHAVRYRQQFVDRLWMRGVLGLFCVYLLGLGVYFGGLRVVRFQDNRMDKRVAALSGAYTNALQMKARMEVLQEQVNLKYAALDSWKVVSELLPPDLTLSWLSFQKGRILHVDGIAPQEQSSQITDYNEALNKARLNGQPVFSKVNPPKLSERPGPGGTRVTAWNFDCELNRTEIE